MRFYNYGGLTFSEQLYLNNFMCFMDILYFSFVYVECLVLLDIYPLVIGFVPYAFFVNLFQKGGK